MTNYEAVGIAEGFIENDSIDRYYEAWQLLIVVCKDGLVELHCI
jgi:hypothetical protein